MNLAVEQSVQDLDRGLGLPLGRQRREPAEVGEPDDAVDSLGLAAFHVSGEDALACVVADIDVQEIGCVSGEREDLGHAGERLGHAAKRVELGVREASGAVGGVGDDVDGSSHEGERNAEVVRHARGPLFDERGIR